MEGFILDLSILLVSAAGLAYFSIVFKQPIIVGYVVAGIIFGPWGLHIIEDISFIEVISHLGITLLLFLAGLNLHPQKLIRLFKETAIITVINCTLSFICVFFISLSFQFSVMDSFIIAMAMMFSSTILAVKLLPTTELHHGRMGAVLIGVLIIQDLLAVAVLAFIRCLGNPEGAVLSFVFLSLKLVAFLVLMFFFEYFILRRIMKKVERIREILFVLGLAWCFGIASISHQMGLFFETGAFFSGVILARHPISLFISENLKPLRDFFLVLFFFALGANLNLFLMKDIVLFSIILACLIVLLKPALFKKSFLLCGESRKFSEEAGCRLGQLSAFSLLIAMLGFETGYLSEKASQFIQFTTILTFVLSSYIIVYKYPTPIGITEKLTRD